MQDSIEEREKSRSLSISPAPSAPPFEESPSTSSALVYGTTLLPLLQKLGINLLIPFLNGIMLGFGEIFAHELGMLLGWRAARGYDPSSMPPATNPQARRRWLFGLW